MTSSMERDAGKTDLLARLAALEEASGELLESRSAGAEGSGRAHDPSGATRSADAPTAPGMSPRELADLLEISSNMYAKRDLRELLSYVIGKLADLWDAENSFVILFDEDGRPHIELARPEPPPGDPLPISQTILERARTEGKSFLIDNTADLEELRHQSSIERLRISSVLCAPMYVEGELIGVLQFDHRGDPHPFTEDERKHLDLFARQAAAAIHKQRLIESLNDFAERAMQQGRLSALGQMAAGIAHDFNNTLFVALGFCDVLLSRKSLDRSVRGYVDKIRTCALDAANTVRRLQICARGHEGDAHLEPVDCSAIASEMPGFTRHMWYTEARRNGVTVSIHTDLAPTPPVAANPADIREVLTNLIFNAVDSVQGSGAIEIASGVQDERVFLSVSDTGVGMDEATLERAFEPFFTTKGTRGCGLGLTTCWSIAQRLGGELRAESRVGEGSRFVLLLPKSDVVARPTPPPRRRRCAPADVLVIDDDPDVLETVRVLIESLGHRVAAFTDARAALGRLGEEPFDVLVSDLGMPELSGYEVATRTFRTHPELPVVILTGWGSDHEPEAGEPEDNVVAVLNKPITLDDLKAALEDALAPRADTVD